MKKEYTFKNFQKKTLNQIEEANKIIAEYQAMGFSLTLRQLYYQFVARDLIEENTQRAYKALGNVINDGRLAGLIDWYSIEDRTRYLRKLAHWDNGADIIDSCIHTFRKSKWDNQDVRLEVWIEKDALIGVIEAVCKRWDVPFFACRGYASQSELFRAGQRYKKYISDGQRPIVFHFGDHDPSGIDMTRDNESRLEMFAEQPIEVRRLALNMDQIVQYDPPPMPAKKKDSRHDGYQAKHGSESWELDALDPNIIADMIENEIQKFVDQDLWDIKLDEEEVVKKELRKVVLDFEQRGV